MYKSLLVVVVMAVAVALGGCRTDSDFGLGGGDNTLPTPDGEEQIIDGVPYSLAVKTSADATQEDFDASESTRTALDHLYKYYWAEGDKIGFSAVGATSKEVVFANNKLVNNQTGQRMSTIFDGVLPKEVYAQMTASQQYRYTAYYPYGQNVECKADSEGNVTIGGLELPSVQNATALGAEGFPTDYDIMVTHPAMGGTLAAAGVNDFKLKFVHLFAAVKLSVSKDRVGGQVVKSITLTAPEGTPLTGKFKVNTATMDVVFTEPSNTVTVNIPESMGGSLDEGDNCVWAIINPVGNESLVVTVETTSGLKYDYTFPVKNYTRGTLHSVAFDIPTFSVKANVYTSYSVYLTSGAKAANELDGQTIYVESPVISSSSDNASEGITYRPVGYSVSCKVNGALVNVVHAGVTEFPVQTLKSYPVEVQLTTANGAQLASATSDVDVTGLPYNIDYKDMSDLEEEWQTKGKVSEENGGRLRLGENQTSLQNNYKSELYRDFYIPATINVQATFQIATYLGFDGTIGTLTVGSTQVWQQGTESNKTWRGEWTNDINTVQTEDATFTTGAQRMTVYNSYGISQNYTDVYKIMLKYR